MARTYLIRMLACGVACVIVVGAINWFIDPLAIYDSPRLMGLNALKPALKTRSRIFKTLQALDGGWEALVIGTSRADVSIDPGHAFFGGRRGFNAAIVGQTPAEGLAIVRGASARGRLRQVLAILDFEPANAHYEGAPDFSTENFRPWRKVALAVNTQTLWLSLKTPWEQDRGSALENNALWLPDGQFVFHGSAKGHHAAALRSERDYIENNFFRGPHREFHLSNGTSRPLDSVREMVRFAHANRIDLTLAISPVHARQLELTGALNLWNDWESWKRSLAAINEEEARRAGREPFPLWDFSGYNDVTTEAFPPDIAGTMRWYFESSHYTPATGALMLDRMAGKGRADFGRILTTANVEPMLEAERRARDEWRASHPDDVAEIDSLVRRYRPAT